MISAKHGRTHHLTKLLYQRDFWVGWRATRIRLSLAVCAPSLRLPSSHLSNDFITKPNYHTIPKHHKGKVPLSHRGKDLGQKRIPGPLFDQGCLIFHICGQEEKALFCSQPTVATGNKQASTKLTLAAYLL